MTELELQGQYVMDFWLAQTNNLFTFLKGGGKFPENIGCME